MKSIARRAPGALGLAAARLNPNTKQVRKSWVLRVTVTEAASANLALALLKTFPSQKRVQGPLRRAGWRAMETRAAVAALIARRGLSAADFLFPSRLGSTPRLSTRHARIVQGWVRSMGLNPATYGTHSLRRTKAALIYRKTGNLRAVQLLLGHTKLESTAWFISSIRDFLAFANR